MKFVPFIEENDHEGETWRFWLQLDGNESELQKLDDWLRELWEELDHLEYSLSLAEHSDEQFVDFIVDHAREEGYMASDNKVTGKFTMPIPDRTLDPWEQADIFYKGRIADFFKENE